MAAVGGSVESITIAGREFPVTADAEIQRKLGGFENEMQANGDGSTRIIKTRVNPMFGGIVVQINDDRGDHEFLQDQSNANDFYPVAITYASGNTYQGLGMISGELQYSSQNATAGFDIVGTGTFTKQ